MKIYCAGGIRSGWGQRVAEALPAFTVFDPASHGLQDEHEYTRWDLDHVAMADVVLANMESNNPSGYGLHLEVGYGKALGKRIVFVDQTPDDKRKYFGMVRACADHTFHSLDEAIAALVASSL